MSDGYETTTTTGVELLLSPFPRDVVQQRAGPGGRSFDYIPVEVVVRRLVDSGLEYSFTQVPGSPPQINQHGNGVNVMLYYGRLHIPALGMPVDDVGTAFIHTGGNEEQYKSAASDCLKRCARLYGIGLEMWEGDPNEATRGRAATELTGGGSTGTPNGGQSYNGSRARTMGDYGVPTSTPSHAPSNGGGKEATDKQLAFIRRLVKERFPMDNDEFNEQAVQAVWTLELKEQGEWATNRAGTSKLIEYLLAMPQAESQPRLQV